MRGGMRDQVARITRGRLALAGLLHVVGLVGASAALGVVVQDELALGRAEPIVLRQDQIDLVDDRFPVLDANS